MPRRPLTSSEQLARRISAGEVVRNDSQKPKDGNKGSPRVKPGDFIELTITTPDSSLELGTRRYYLCPEDRPPPEDLTEYTPIGPNDFRYKSLEGKSTTDQIPYLFDGKLAKITVSKILDHPEPTPNRQSPLPK